MNTPLPQFHAWLDPTQYSVQLAKHTNTRCTSSWTAGGRHGGAGKEEGWIVGGGARDVGGEQVGGREGQLRGVKEGWNKRRDGGSDGPREGASGSGGKE